MNAFERRNKIVELLNQHGSVLVNDLSPRFNVSEVTIRTDLRLLEKTGVLLRFHGGAAHSHLNLSDTPLNELQLEERYQCSIDPKKHIALAAMNYVQDGSSIILDSGSTTMMIAEELVKLKNITVITNNLPAAFILSDNMDIVLFVCGGTLRHKTRSMHGRATEQCLEGLAADLLFVGADGIDPQRGITTFNEGFAISSMMAKAANKVIAVVDSSKFGRSGLNTVLPLKQLDTIITDRGVDDKYRQAFTHQHIEFITAG
ncbi:DeoR/GlpR family DNA-binding transcription regulator [Utexia brackfieldae]|uniref:DeoR/GlpR family DNA-binding transcription regulator n=1 Tax=Utexia brackfieldae TaxID=3074108 RepID=UPI00370D8FAB